MKKLLIIGAGGFGKELFGYISDDIEKGYLKNIKIKGFLDTSRESFEKANLPTDFYGSENNYKIEEDDIFLVSIGNVKISRKVYENLEKRGAEIYTYIHSSCIVDKSAKVGKGVIVCPYSIINSQAIINDFCSLNIFTSVGHDSILGKGSILSPYASLNGNVTAGKNLFMGTRATILLGSTIGDNCTISAHTAVKGTIGNNFMIKDKVNQIQVKNRLI